MLNPFKKEEFDYKIVIVTMSEYKGLITLNAKKELLTSLFDKAKRKLHRQENLHIKGKDEFIERFEIPERYFKLLTTYTEGIFSLVAKTFYERCPKDKKFQLLTHFVTGCWFERDISKNWLIKIEIAGNHILK